MYLEISYIEHLLSQKKFFDNKIPEYKNPNDDDRAFEVAIEEIPNTVGKLIEEFKFREGLVEIIKIAKKRK